jgi:hypothetical protein
MPKLEREAPETLTTTFGVNPGAYLERLVVHSGCSRA